MKAKHSISFLPAVSAIGFLFMTACAGVPSFSHADFNSESTGAAPTGGPTSTETPFFDPVGGLDLDGDLEPDVDFIDENFDGGADSVDVDRDGTPDTPLIPDKNDDTVSSFDRDNDGNPDTTVKDTDGDKVPDVVINNEDPNTPPDEGSAPPHKVVKCEGSEGDGQLKVLLCHIPSGNSNAKHEICVGAPAVRAHIGHHGGDYLGTCRE